MVFRRRLKGRTSTYVDGHLDARLRACTFEDDVEAVGHVELGERSRDVLLGAAQSLVGRLGLVCHGEAVDLLSETVLQSKVEASLVDVDRDDARGTIGLRERARKEADCTNTEDEDGLS